MDSTRTVELLVLDFAGVCTPSAAELIAGGADPSAIIVRPECEHVVRSAQDAGVVVAVLSNEIDRAWSASVPFLSDVDHVVACSDNNIFKPDRRAFQRCLLIAGVAAGATLVVDDNEDNITVAASLGTHTVLFDVDDAAASWHEVSSVLS